MDIEISGLEDIKNINEEDNDSNEMNLPFSWEEELNQLEKNYIKSANILEEGIDGTRDARARIVSAENHFFDLHCSIEKGIKVIETDYSGAKGAIFESFETLLLLYSPRYNQIFDEIGQN